MHRLSKQEKAEILTDALDVERRERFAKHAPRNQLSGQLVSEYLAFLNSQQDLNPTRCEKRVTVTGEMRL